MRSCLSLLFSRLNSPRFQPFPHTEDAPGLLSLGGPPLDSLQQFPLSRARRGPELDTALQLQPHQGTAEGRITSLNLPATLFAMHPGIPLAFLATRAHRWLMDNLLSTRTPRSFSTQLQPLTALLHAVLLPQVQDSTLALADLHQVQLQSTSRKNGLIHLHSKYH